MVTVESIWPHDGTPSLWFTEVSLPYADQWAQIGKSLEGHSEVVLTSRKVTLEFIEVREFAYKKSDRRAPTGFYEKVAADLAGLLGLPVAAVLLHNSDSVVSAYTQAGPTCQSVSHVRWLCGDPVADNLAELYPWGLWAFDAWIANDDRKESEIVLNERPRPHLYGIDHGAAFGVGSDGLSSWANTRAGQDVKNIHTAPLPDFVKVASVDRDAVHETAQRIAALSVDVVKFVVERADHFYREHSARASMIDATAVLTGLLERKENMVKWSEVLR